MPNVTPDPRCDLRAGQHSDENGPFEVFWSNPDPNDEDTGPQPNPGWYWRSCSPGCLPDGNANGPFNTSTEAWQAAKDDAEGEGEPAIGTCPISKAYGRS